MGEVHVRSFVLCDTARRSKRDGCGWELRTVDRLTIKEGDEFALKAFFALAFVNEAGEYGVSFVVLGPDGESLATSPPQPIRGDGAPLHVQERVARLQLIFPIPGRYTVVLRINGDSVSFAEVDVVFAVGLAVAPS